MVGKVASGQVCTVRPIGDEVVLSVGDIVLCQVGGYEDYLIKAIRGGRYQIGNNRGRISGDRIFGKCIRFEN